MDLKIRGKVALVTGSGRGIGAEASRQLAQEGARAVICDIDVETADATAQNLRDEGFEAMAIQCDVCDKEQVQAGIEAVVTEWGGVELLDRKSTRLKSRHKCNTR